LPPGGKSRHYNKGKRAHQSWAIESTCDTIAVALKAPIRILQLVASSRGGGATHVRDLALGLDPRRFRVEVAMPADGGTVTAADFAAAGLPFHQLAIQRGPSLPALARLRRLMTAFDIVHAHGSRAALFARLASLSLGRRRPRLIFTVHGFATPYYSSLKRAALLAIERALGPFTDLTIAVCEAERAALVETGLGHGRRLVVAYYGIALDGYKGGPGPARAAARANLGVGPDALLILTVCRLDQPRDFTTLLAGFESVALAMREAHLLIAGDGPFRPAIERAIAERWLGARATLAGWQKDTAPLYAASDIYTLTTWGWEGLPLTVLEAMASSLPVVATRAGGTPDAVVEAETGLLVPRRDEQALGAALARLAAEPELRRTMGAAGRARAERLFTVERMVADIADLYAELAAGNVGR
jgi:glycosyltransferase involved in cell wall biosynthesis